MSTIGNSPQFSTAGVPLRTAPSEAKAPIPLWYLQDILATTATMAALVAESAHRPDMARVIQFTGQQLGTELALLGDQLAEAAARGIKA